MVEVMIGAAGGDIELGDVSLTIPADAVPDGTMMPVQPGTFIDIAPAVDHVCGVRPSGALSCWGAGYANLP